jgi:hypothetical protein
MHRFRSLGRSLRGLLARPVRAVAKILRPIAAAGAALGSTIARILRPAARPARRAGRPVKGLVLYVVSLIPALLAGVGVFLVVAGLFNYFAPASAVPLPSDVAALGTPAAYTLPPLVTPAPTPSGHGSPGATASQTLSIATRVVIPALNVDVPVVASPPNEQYPWCNAAEYLTLGEVYAYPGAPRATYIYAHARVGMFWNLLVQSKIRNGAAMLGDYVEVFTDDDQNHLYEISRVIRHVPATTGFADQAIAATTDELWLQTSEGHANSSTKLQIVATPIGVVAASQADAHPRNTATVCPDAPFCTAPGQGGCRR